MKANHSQPMNTTAERGDAVAQSDLGAMLVGGIGVEKDEAEGVKCFRKSAEQNFATGQYHLGLMCHDGRGVPKDRKEAYRWMRKAAEQRPVSQLLPLAEVLSAQRMDASGNLVPLDAESISNAWWTLRARWPFGLKADQSVKVQ
jgi:hypothetical protein